MLYPGSVGAVEQALAALSSVPEAVIIVEPDTEIVSALTARFSGMQNVKILNRSVGPSGADVTVTAYNVPGLRSTRAPTPALLSLFPGIKPTKQFLAHPAPVSELLEGFDKLPSPRRLLIDGLGFDADALTELQKAGLLERFDQIAIHCGAEAFFEGSSSSVQVTETLIEAGYKLDLSDQDDPDMPVLYFSTDRAARDIRALKARVQALETELVSKSAEAHSQAAKITDLQSESDVQKQAIAGHIKALETAKSEHKDALSSLQSKLDASEMQSQSHLAMIKDLQSSSEAQKQAFTDQIKALETAETKHKDALTALHSKLNASEKQSQSRLSMVTELQKTLHDRDEKLAAADALRQASEQAFAAETATSAQTIKALQDENAALLYQKSVSEQRFAEQSAKLAELEATLQLRTTELADLQTQLAQAKQQAEANAALVTDETTKVQKLADALRESESRKAILEKQISGFASQVAELEVRLRTQEAELADSIASAANTQTETALSAEAQAHEEVESLRQALTAAKAASEDQAKSYANRVSELEHRLTLSRNELRRAEGQIDIIKDLLLRESSL